MPGIVGIISRGCREENERNLNVMIDCMMHESFYMKGHYINDQLGLYAGLVCHRGSFSDCMPIVNAKEDVVLLFSGENFADKSVTEQFKRDSHALACSSMRYLVRLYEDEGEAFLRRLNGWFCGILIDLRKAMVILFNDRYGMHRVYYHEGKDTFFFASEAKSLLKIRPELRKIDMESLGQYVSCDCVLQNRTLFSGVSILPGGSSWTWQNNNGVRKNSYFKPSAWEEQPLLEEETFYGQLQETILNILPRYFPVEERIGMSVTGGLDSRMIMACLNPPPGTLPCYTFGGIRDMLDIRIARKVAEACQQTHDVIRLDHNFFSEFPKLAEQTVYISDGGLSICSAHDLYFNRLAREIAPIRVTGKFGSEVIRDHTMLNETRTCEQLFLPDFNMYIRKGVEALSEIKRGHKLSVAVFKEFPWHEYSKLAVEQSQLTFRTPYMDNDLIELMYKAPESVRASNAAQRSIIGRCNPILSSIMTDRGVVLESSSLFSRFIELYYYLIFKADYIYVFDLPHWLAKLDAICTSVNGGRQILGYQKFEYYRIWFRNEFSSYIKEILLDRKTINRSYFNKNYLEMITEKHIKGEGNYLNEINRAMTIELIHRLLVEI